MLKVSCELVVSLIWEESTADKLYGWKSGETTANLNEIKDIKSKRAKRKRKEANSGFPSTQTAYLLLILLAPLLRVGVSCPWAAVRMWLIGSVLKLGGNNCQLWWMRILISIKGYVGWGGERKAVFLFSFCIVFILSY